MGYDNVTIRVFEPWRAQDSLDAVTHLLASRGLSVDPDIELFATASDGDRLIGCLGLAGSVIKCAAVAVTDGGEGVLGRLVQEVHYLALARGRGHLFCYTRPQTASVFESLGFHRLAEAPGRAVLLENTPFGLTEHCAQLHEAYYRPGERIGSVVLNANPFTRGHAHLVQAAAAACDVLHVAVVSQDSSEFDAGTRLRLVKEGCAALPHADRIVVRPSGPYLVSRATFPTYFMKDAAAIAEGVAALDLQLFRGHIAPALGITDRFVGTEPICPVTAAYNREMWSWLTTDNLPSRAIGVHVIERLTDGGTPISASRVRAALAAGRRDELARLVPPTTLAHLLQETR